jgi:hypothetical protein
MKKPFVLVGFVANKPVKSAMKIVRVLLTVHAVKPMMGAGLSVELQGSAERLLVLKVRKDADVFPDSNVTKGYSVRMTDKVHPSVFVLVVLQAISTVAVSPIEVVG